MDGTGDCMDMSCVNYGVAFNPNQSLFYGEPDSFLKAERRDSPFNDSLSSASSSSSSPMAVTPALCKTQKLCPVCGENAFNKHFGVLCCNACAAFFRRTLTFQRTYSCAKGKNCEISALEQRHMCKFCRFRRCALVGMNLGAISPKDFNDDIPGFDADSPIRQVLQSQRGTFVNRFASVMKAANGNKQLICAGQANPTFVQGVMTTFVEFDVLVKYLKCNGFERMGLDEKQLHILAQAIFYDWVCYQTVLATLRNGGDKDNETYFADESHLPTTYESLLHFVANSSGLIDPRTVAEYAIQCFSTGIEAARKIHAKHMDEVEFAVVFQVYALKTAQKLFPQYPEIKQKLDQVFVHIERHYDHNYDDVALRMGNVVLSMELIQNCTKLFGEYVSMLHLNGYDTILSKMRNRQGGR